MGRRLVAVVVLLLSVPEIFAQGLIITVTGRSWTFAGEGPLAVNAPLGQVPAVAVDPSGNVFAADSENAIVVRISTAGALTVVAGNGTRSFLGDGGLAREAALADPRALALDRLGNLYITDGERVRKVSPDGMISTVAGIGVPGFSGDGGPAADAQLDSPQGIAVDEAGNLYLADANNHRIRKVSASGIINTVAGTGDRSFFGGFSGDGGLATSAQLNSPEE